MAENFLDGSLVKKPLHTHGGVNKHPPFGGRKFGRKLQPETPAHRKIIVWWPYGGFLAG